MVAILGVIYDILMNGYWVYLIVDCHYDRYLMVVWLYRVPTIKSVNGLVRVLGLLNGVGDNYFKNLRLGGGFVGLFVNEYW